MHCWKDMNSVSNFSYTLPDTRYTSMGRHEQRHVFPTMHSERQLGCRTSCLSYILIDAQYALLEKHEQRQQLLLSNN